MIELLKIHALVRMARVLVRTGAAADYVRMAAWRDASPTAASPGATPPDGALTSKISATRTTLTNSQL
jgi:hypothetical protein